jgi:hypothetical protein
MISIFHTGNICPTFAKKGLNYLIKWTVVTCAFCNVFLFCSAQQQNENKKIRFPEDYPVLHPRYRSWPVPAGNIEVSYNPGILMWPSTLKKGTTYDIRLSQDPKFDKEKTISAYGIPWTIYNPHRALNAGVWYWQYRIHNDVWKDVQQFRVTDNATPAVSPSADEFLSAIPESYPRVLITKKEAQAFRQRAMQTKDALILIDEADKSLSAQPPHDEVLKHPSKDAKGNDYMSAKLVDKDSKYIGFNAMAKVKIFCQAYLLTGNKKYADRGILWAREIASWHPEGPSGISDFGDAGCMLAMALAFDTFHDLLSSSDKEILLDKINIRAGRIYNEWINDIDAKVLSNHVWQFTLHYFFQTALAVHGQLKDADKWLTYVYELWLARAPVLGGSEGGWLEGASYFRINMETMLDIPTIIKNYTGYDFINRNKWYDNNPYWMYYSFPPGSFADGFGDNVETVRSPGLYYLAYADALSKLTGSRMAATYAGKIEKTGKVKLSDVIKDEPPETANMFRWFRLRYLLNKQRPSELPDSSFASAIVLNDVGIVDMHSDINDIDKDLMVSMRSSPYGNYGHMLADQNTFNVLYGGQRLFYLSGHKVAMKDPHRLLWYKATVGHNGVLIDDRGQTFDSKGYGWISRFLNGKNISYAVGDASMAYGASSSKENTGLKKFKRHLLLIRPDIVIVYDELIADHAAEWKWLIHSPQKINLSSSKNEFYCSLKNTSVVTSLFTPQPVRMALSDTFGVAAVNWLGRKDKDGNPRTYENNSWHVSAATVNPTPKMRFLAIIKINVGARPSQKQLYHLATNNEVVLGNWRIRAELDTSKPALLEVFSNDGKVGFSSGGNQIQAGSQTYSGAIRGSAKLAELIDGKWEYHEAGDRIPELIQQIPVKHKK